MRRKFYTVLKGNSKALAILPEDTKIVALQPAGERPPFFIVDSYPHFIDVVKLMGADQPVLSLIGQEETQLTDTYSIVDEATSHVRTILEHRPNGPYFVGGCSASGIVAYEAAQQLRALGHDVALLALFDTPNPYFMREYSHLHMSLNSYLTDLSRLRWAEIPGWLGEKLRGLMGGGPSSPSSKSNAANETRSKIEQFGPLSMRVIAARKYRPGSYPGRVLLVKREHELIGRYRDRYFGWGDVVSGKIDVCNISSLDHLEIFKSELDRAAVAQSLRKCIDEVIEHHRRPSPQISSDQPAHPQLQLQPERQPQ
jgi:thioesterase domain-containing protein